VTGGFAVSRYQRHPASGELGAALANMTQPPSRADMDRNKKLTMTDLVMASAGAGALGGLADNPADDPRA
jgi:hypothetical protein